MIRKISRIQPEFPSPSYPCPDISILFKGSDVDGSVRAQAFFIKTIRNRDFRLCRHSDVGRLGSVPLEDHNVSILRGCDLQIGKKGTPIARSRMHPLKKDAIL